MSDLTERITKIEQGLKTFRMIGSGGAKVEGSFGSGYCVTCPELTGAGEEGGGGGVTPPPITNTGACCIGTDCTITTETNCIDEGGIYQGNNTICSPNPCSTGACCVGTDCSIQSEPDCILLGGTYQGDDTVCDPSPCGSTGACCVGTDCTIETEADCIGIGGVYQGDGTTCDTNPCFLPECMCGFNAFDGSGRKFLTRISTVHRVEHRVSPPCDQDESGTLTEQYDPVTCVLTSSGSLPATACGSNCANFGLINIISATEATYHDEFNPPFIQCTTDAQQTLSDECLPI